MLDGTLAGGERLAQTELAEKLGVSTTPVREALRDLSTEGLVVFDPHRGALVRSLNIGEVRELYELRMTLEPVMVQRVIDGITGDQIARADDLQKRMEQPCEMSSWVTLNRDFHAVFNEVDAGSRLASILTGLRDSAAPYVALSLAAPPPQVDQASKEHAELVRLYRDHSGDRARDDRRAPEGHPCRDRRSARARPALIYLSPANRPSSPDADRRSPRAGGRPGSTAFAQVRQGRPPGLELLRAAKNRPPRWGPEKRSATVSDTVIEQITSDTGPHFEPYGWHHWPEFPWMSYQFRRALGETQPGGGSVSEVFQAASRMVAGDAESWFTEWRRIADRSFQRAAAAEEAGHVVTARDAWLRACDYYRSAEFWLAADDPRRLETFSLCEESFSKAGRYFRIPVEQVQVPYENGAFLPAYFLRAPGAADGRQPVLIAFGGLDSFKEELYFMVGRGALDRGISCLLVDGPGQGAALRRQHLLTRYDYEVPVAACVDYLLGRGDVDPARIAVSGSSLGGYYAARAGSKEHRLAAVVSHGAIWDIHELWQSRGEDFGLAGHIKWVFGTGTMREALERTREFTLDGVLEEMQCPYLIVHGGHDVLGVQQASQTADYARSKGVDVTFHLVSADETGAEHCQHDNPTLGMELIADWLADVFGIDERGVIGR